MITNVFNAVKGFFAYIRSFFDAIFNLFSKVVSLLSYAVSYINIVLHALPAWIWIILTILLSACIIMKVLGRSK